MYSKSSSFCISMDNGGHIVDDCREDDFSSIDSMCGSFYNSMDNGTDILHVFNEHKDTKRWMDMSTDDDFLTTLSEFN